MGRHRTRHRGLPPHLHVKGGSYYYVTNGAPRKWIALGPDLRYARARWAELEGDREAHTVAQLIDRVIPLCDVKDSSRRQYQSWGDAIVAGIGDYLVASLQTYHVAQWRDDNAHRRAYVNGCLSLLRQAYAKAREWGWCEHDPVPRRFKLDARKRLLTHDEFRSIRAQATAWLQNAMDLAYLTGLRESDVLALRWDRVGAAMTVEQVKTGARQEYALGGALGALLERCRAGRVRGLFVIADERGRQIRPDRLIRHYAKARDAAGVKDSGFHDIRALAATDAKRAGINYQALLGHATPSMSERYVRGFETTKAEPLRKVL